MGNETLTFERHIGAAVIPNRADAERYVAKVCFKTGPPRRLGAEFEWIVLHHGHPTRPLDRATLVSALADHVPRTLRPDSPHLPLPHGGLITVEPGGQVEISTPPIESLADLLAISAADTDHLASLLGASGLRLGDGALDARRPSRRILDTPRYAAMEQAFDRIGPHGRTMMCGTASVQICLDAGGADRVWARWNALHAIGPTLLAVFANTPSHERPAAGAGPAAPRNGRHLGWASERMRAWFGVDPSLSRALAPEADPAEGWARRALDSPVLCVRQETGSWEAPPGVTFAEWIAGALPRPPTYDDLDYHLTTLFPHVRPRGYLEVRYLDAQPSGDVLVPVALVGALFARERTVDAAADIAGAAADRWVQAARDGLSDPVLRDTAGPLVDLACRAMADTDLSSSTITAVAESVSRRLSRGVAT